jgi:D-glycero-D-manno-heptose 1,7-bisphosphate phosphatase
MELPSAPLQAEKEIIMVCGYPASGKSTLSESYRKQGYTVLSRDEYGGSTRDLVGHLDGAGDKIVLDNTHLNVATRAPFVKWARDHGVPISAVWVDTTIEDCQIRHLRRMWKTYGRLFMDGKLPPELRKGKGKANQRDAHVYPAAVFFRARKQWVPPTQKEGFAMVYRATPPLPVFDTRGVHGYRHKALFLDIDGTLRKYPIEQGVVEPLLDDVETMTAMLRKKIKEGYRLVGVSNQSGIAMGKTTEEDVKKYMDETRALFGLEEEEFGIHWCPHKPAPITCYCRKPQVGMAIEWIETLKLNPKHCIMVGDRKTDETFATRMGMKYIHPDDFWTSAE